MAELIIKGTIKEKLTIETGTSKAGKDWSKQNFVLDTGLSKFDTLHIKAGSFLIFAISLINSTNKENGGNKS